MIYRIFLVVGLLIAILKLVGTLSLVPWYIVALIAFAPVIAVFLFIGIIILASIIVAFYLE